MHGQDQPTGWDRIGIATVMLLITAFLVGAMTPLASAAGADDSSAATRDDDAEEVVGVEDDDDDDDDDGGGDTGDGNGGSVGGSGSASIGTKQRRHEYGHDARDRRLEARSRTAATRARTRRPGRPGAPGSPSRSRTARDRPRSADRRPRSLGAGDARIARGIADGASRRVTRSTPGRSAIKRLGGGLRYEAYLAWDDHLRSLVVDQGRASRDSSTTAARSRGLASEVRLLERLDHPVLLRSFGAELEGPRPHVVLEHLEGPRLSTLLRKYGPLLPEQLVPLAVQLCAAIHYMSGEGVAHLDLKPSNIIMGGPPRLIDLSVARTLEQCERLDSPVGTDAYMSPEQCQPGGRRAGRRRCGRVGPGCDPVPGCARRAPVRQGRPGRSRAERALAAARRVPEGRSTSVAAPPIADPIMACLARDPAGAAGAGQR